MHSFNELHEVVDVAPCDFRRSLWNSEVPWYRPILMSRGCNPDCWYIDLPTKLFSANEEWTGEQNLPDYRTGAGLEGVWKVNNDIHKPKEGTIWKDISVLMKMVMLLLLLLLCRTALCIVVNGKGVALKMVKLGCDNWLGGLITPTTSEQSLQWYILFVL